MVESSTACTSIAAGALASCCSTSAAVFGLRPTRVGAADALEFIPI